MIIPIVLIYFIVSIIALLNPCVRENKVKFIFFLVVWIILAVIATFRPDTMPDYLSYKYAYLGIFEDRFEIGFRYISLAMKKLYFGLYAYLFVIALLSISLKLISIFRMTNLIFFSFLIYLSNFFILHDMIQIRCAIASGIFLISIYYIQHRNLKLFLLSGFLALLFHYTAIIIFPLWFLSTQKSYKWFYILLIPCSLFFVGKFSLLSTIIQYLPIAGIQKLWILYEVQVGDEINIYNAISLSRIFICLIFLYCIDNIKEKNEYAIILGKIYSISIVFFFLFSDLPNAARRISEFYQIVEIILIPLLIYSFEGFDMLKRILVILIGFCFLYMNVEYMAYLK